MPCFKGLAVSIHTPDGPIAEHGVQKQTRASRISTYIPVPPAKVPKDSATGKPEQSTFAISITLLTPGLNVPYSTPKPTLEDPYPRPRVVGGLPGFGSERGKYAGSVPPYIPRTTNPNETIAAYIYFDGRAKEEVATLLRRGEETWVNSRWVSVPESEGGGLAEREFLFREVGLERWLNGLDLQGTTKEKAERIERRQRRLEKKRQKIKDEQNSDDEDVSQEATTRRLDRNGVLRYGGEGSSPVEDIRDDDGLFSSDSDSDDDPPQPEAAGQIKVALFRVLASGEIKKGEYSPQFDAHDDDDNTMDGGEGGGDEDVDHTTSFAKPKTLDPESISTQTVTGLDPPESPYAVFTFFYRGEKQLKKMGVISTSASEKLPQPGRRKSAAQDFSKFGPLKATGTVGFSGYRDASSTKRKSKNKDNDAMDSDADDEDDERLPNGDDEAEVKQENGDTHTSPDADEVAEGVQKIKLKRQYSAEALSEPSAAYTSPHLKADECGTGTAGGVKFDTANAGTPPSVLAPPVGDASEAVASPYKRQRASLPGMANSLFSSEAGFLPASSLSTATSAADDQAGTVSAESAPAATKADEGGKADSDEEL